MYLKPKVRGEGIALAMLVKLLDWARAEKLPLALRTASVVLTRWQGWVAALPPHDALHAIYDDGDVLARFGAAAPQALRDGVLANLRALLSAALQIDGGRFVTPYAFVRALKAPRSDPRMEPVARDMRRRVERGRSVILKF